jgi:RimJ/RimL family protein N-acetyltransferase
MERRDGKSPEDEQVRKVLRELLPYALADNELCRNEPLQLGHAHRAALIALLSQYRPDSAGLAESVHTWGDIFDWYGAQLTGEVRDPTFSASSSPRVQIRALQPSDVPSLYSAASDPVLGHRWRYRGRTPSFAEFEATLFEGVLAQFAVAPKDSGAICGLVTLYNADLANGHAFLGVVRGKRVPGDQGSMMDGCILLIQHAFASWPLRKIYFEVPGYNMHLVDGLIDAGFATEEGRLQEFFFFNGEYFDKVYVSIHRHVWLERMGPWFSREIGQRQP